MKRFPLFLAAACLAGAFASSRASDVSSLLPFLEMPVGAKACALGRAFTPLADDLSAIHWNPAGLCGGNGASVGFSYQDWFLDSGFTQYQAAWRKGKTGYGASLGFLDYGDFETRDMLGMPMGPVAASSFGGIVAAARSLGALQVGVDLRYFREGLPETDARNALAFGTAVLAPVRKARFSAGFRNLRISAPGPIPQSIFLGMSLRASGGEWTLIPVTDVEIRDGKGEGHLGLEAGLRDEWFIRLGHRFDGEGMSFGDLDGMSFGFGIRRGRADLGYALSANGALGGVHTLSLAWDLSRGPSEAPKKDKKAKPKKGVRPDNRQLLISGLSWFPHEKTKIGIPRGVFPRYCARESTTEGVPE